MGSLSLAIIYISGLVLFNHMVKIEIDTIVH